MATVMIRHSDLPAEPPPSLAQDHALLCDAVRVAGQVALGYYRGKNVVREKKPGDPVSEADLAVDAELKRWLAGARPDYGWMSEETADTPARLDAARVWVVDPIDGTKGFIAGNDEYALSAALVEKGRPVAAAIYNPSTGEFFEAMLGGGARLNGFDIRATAKTTTRGLKLGTSRNELRRNLWVDLFPEAEVIALDAIAYKLAMVAAGRFDGVISLRAKSDWDIAAGDLLVYEAGGVITDLEGGVLRYNQPVTRHPNLVASGSVIFSALRARLAKR